MKRKEPLEKYIRPLEPLPTGMKARGTPRAEIRAILFDVYGTLFVSSAGEIGTTIEESDLNPAIRGLFTKYGIRGDPRTVLSRFSRAIVDEHEELNRDGIDHPEVEIDRIWSRVLENDDRESVRDFAVEYEWIVNPAYPMPHLRELMAACKDKGITMGIISNAQFYTPDLFRWFFDADPKDLGFHPGLTFYSYQFKHAKPSPLMFQAAVDALGKMSISQHSALYLGNDKLNDIYPAKTAGFQTALFAGDRRSLRLREDDIRCRNLKPDLVITDLIQLLGFL